MVRMVDLRDGLVVMSVALLPPQGHWLHWFIKVEGAEAANKAKKAVCTIETALEETDSRDSAQLHSGV